MKRMVALLFTLTLLLGVAGLAVSETVTMPQPMPTPTFTPEQWLQTWYQIGVYLRQSGNYPFVELRKGDTGYEVRNLQTRLTELGYYSKAIVDTYGTGTYTAMRQFEKQNHLTVNGVASVKDQKRLYSFEALTSGGESADNGTATADTATPGNTEATAAPGKSGLLRTLNPDILNNLLATPTPTPTLFHPKVTIPAYQVAFP